MSISIKNFGPISTGTIRLLPLTVFIGPSNSGKSYAARLAYRTARSFQILGGGFDVPLDAFMRMGNPDTKTSMYASALSDMRRLVEKLAHRGAAEIPKSTLSRILGATLSPLPATLTKELRREFKSDLGNLVRFSASGLSIDISGPLRAHMEWPANSKATPKNTSRAKYWVVRDPDSGDVALKVEREGKTSVSPLPTRSGHFEEKDSELMDDIARDLTNIVMNKLRASNFPPNERTFFFSLSRSPLANMVESSDNDAGKGRSPHADPGNYPPSGLPEGFMQFMLSIDVNSHGPLSKLATRMERDLFSGNTVLTKPVAEGMPTISLRTSGKRVPLRLVSSHVSSMSLLTIYLKYLIAPGDRIIIEEPEAHMHPANQLKFARYVALLIRSGVNVTLVTHSVLIIERLSAYMMLGALDKERRKKATDNPNTYLTLDEVSAHEFIVRSKGNCTVRDIPCSKYDGMEQDQFGQMRLNMYNERSLFQSQIEEYTDDPEQEKT